MIFRDHTVHCVEFAEYVFRSFRLSCGVISIASGDSGWSVRAAKYHVDACCAVGVAMFQEYAAEQAWPVTGHRGCCAELPSACKLEAGASSGVHPPQGC